MTDTRWVALFVTSLMLLYFALFLASGADAYWLKGTDLQNDYFFGGALGAHGMALGDVVHPGNPAYYLVLHPGVPAYYLIGLVERAFAHPFRDIARIFDVAYALVIVAIVAALIHFVFMARRRAPAALVALALLPIFLWAPFWYYLTCYGADAWVIPIGLVVLSETWRAIFDPAPRPLPLVASGALAGIGMAVKLSLLPLIGICVLGLLVRYWGRRQAWCTLWMSVAALAAFLLGIAPVISDLPTLLHQLVAPPPYLAAHAIAGQIFFSSLLQNPLGWLEIMFALLTTIAAFIALVRHHRQPPMLSAAVLLLLLLAFLVKTITLTSLTAFAAVTLRNSSSAILLFPFGVLLAWELWPRPFAPRVSLAIQAAAALVALAAMASNLSAQAGFVAYQRSQETWLAHQITARLAPGSAPLLGGNFTEAGFLLYGNNVYGHEFFTRLVGGAVPDIGYLRLRQFDILTTGNVPEQGLKALWLRLFPRREDLRERLSPIVALPASSATPGLAVLAGGEIPGHCPLNCLIGALAREGYKVFSIEKLPYRDQGVIFLRLASRPAGQ